MNFDSIIFISCFLPALLILYWLIPGLKGKNRLLLVCSLLFYSFGGLSSLLLLVALAGVNYLLGLILCRKGPVKWALILGVSLNVAFLGFFKYLNFFVSQVLLLAPVELGLAIPLGISFFTFKSISYLVDTYRNRENGTESFWDFLLYISFFPQIITGPITRFRDFVPQLGERTHSPSAAAAGMQRFIRGLAKKLILSGILGNMVDSIFGLSADVLDARLAWIGAIGYCLQLYYDFSGYIDMANGLAGIFGFITCENFDRPYLALSIGDFWRRWHISLSTWFRDYVYIPMGGNRKGSIRAGINKCIVFLLCGIWHGAAWTFLLWGVWHGVFSLLESTGVIPAKKLQKHKVIGHVYTLLVVCLGFVMFRAETVAQGSGFLSAMFTGFSFTAAGTVALHTAVTAESAAMLVLGALLCLPLPTALKNRVKAESALAYAGSFLLLMLSIIVLAAGGFAPSIYAGF